MSLGQDEILYVHFFGRSYDRNDKNCSWMGIASLVVGCFTCMHTLSFVENTHLHGNG